MVVVAHDLNPLLSVLDGAIYLLDGHAHYGAIGSVVDEELLTHLYGTQIRVVRTATGRPVHPERTVNVLGAVSASSPTGGTCSSPTSCATRSSAARSSRSPPA